MIPQATDSPAPETVRTHFVRVHEFGDKRVERRIPQHSTPAKVRIGEDAELASARVLDISPSGVRLGMDSSPAPGSNATVWFHNTVATGQVRYSRRNADGSFDVGLRLLDVLNRI